MGRSPERCEYHLNVLSLAKLENRPFVQLWPTSRPERASLVRRQGHQISVGISAEVAAPVWVNVPHGIPRDVLVHVQPDGALLEKERVRRRPDLRSRVIIPSPVVKARVRRGSLLDDDGFPNAFAGLRSVEPDAFLLVGKFPLMRFSADSARAADAMLVDAVTSSSRSLVENDAGACVAHALARRA